MEAVEVTVRFDTNGKVTPLRFTWKDIRYQVESTGRRWQAADGQHILVMVVGGGVFELLFVPQAGVWYLGRADQSRMAV
jgi:hypothetical protein